ncbi:MAG: EamA family transporter [Acidobacteria bacterium]|nr:EamA family transporter [Acidobacteriota bacterium]
MFKQGMKQGGTVSLTSVANVASLLLFVLTTPKILIGLSLSGISMILWLTALSRFELSYALPVLSGVYYILALLMSYLVLNEPINLWRWAGTAVIALGIALLAHGG